MILHNDMDVLNCTLKKWLKMAYSMLCICYYNMKNKEKEGRNDFSGATLILEYIDYFAFTYQCLIDI